MKVCYTLRMKKILPLICMIIMLPLIYSIEARALPLIEDEGARRAIPAETDALPGWPLGPSISAQTAILMDADSGVILYSKRAHERMYPASTTKLLTCLIAYENSSPDEIVTASHRAVFTVPRDSSNIAIDEGESITMDEALQAILIASANEVANAVAEHVSGDIESFCERMNEAAEALGCTDSHFANPNGLPDENHYTSSYDLALIGRAFWRHDVLATYSSMPKLDLEPTLTQPDHIIEYSRNQLFTGKPYAYRGLVGSKTGYTQAASNTLVSCAEREGMRLVCVVMGDGSPECFEDTVALFDYGYDYFTKSGAAEQEDRVNLVPSEIFAIGTALYGDNSPMLTVDSTDSVILPTGLSYDDLDSEISMGGEGGEVASITYSYAGQYLGTVRILQAERTTPRKPDSPYFIEINLAMLAGGALIVAGGLILIISLRSYIADFHFNFTDRTTRRQWRHSKKAKPVKLKRPKR